MKIPQQWISIVFLSILSASCKSSSSAPDAATKSEGDAQAGPSTPIGIGCQLQREDGSGREDAGKIAFWGAATTGGERVVTFDEVTQASNTVAIAERDDQGTFGYKEITQDGSDIVSFDGFTLPATLTIVRRDSTQGSYVFHFKSPESGLEASITQKVPAGERPPASSLKAVGCELLPPSGY